MFSTNFFFTYDFFFPFHFQPSPTQKLHRLGALLANENLEATLQCNTVARELVIRAEPSGVSAEGRVAFGINLLQRVHTLAIDEVDLEMHGLVLIFFKKCDLCILCFTFVIAAPQKREEQSPKNHGSRGAPPNHNHCKRKLLTTDSEALLFENEFLGRRRGKRRGEKTMTEE